MKRDEARIRTPCPAEWDDMRGDDTHRHCDTCDKTVHNLSAMTEAEARAVVAPKGVCVRYELDTGTGRIRHRTPSTFAVRLTAAAALTAGLAVPAAAAISREPGEVGLLAGAWEALTDWYLAEEVSEEPPPLLLAPEAADPSVAPDPSDVQAFEDEVSEWLVEGEDERQRILSQIGDDHPSIMVVTGDVY